MKKAPKQEGAPASTAEDPNKATTAPPAEGAPESAPPAEDEGKPNEGGEDDPPKDEKGPVPFAEDPLMETLRKDLGIDPEIKKVDEEEPKPEGEEPKEEKAAEPTKVDKPKAEQKPKVKKKVEVQPRAEEPEEKPVELPPVEAKKPDEAKADPDEEYIASLPEDNREEIVEAQWAEKNLNKKGHAKKLVEWYRGLDALYAKTTAEDPGATFDESNPEVKKYLASKPRFTAAEQKKITSGMVTEAVEAKLRKESESRIEEVERTAKEAKFKPEIDGIVKQFNDGVNKIVGEDEGPAAEAVKALATDAKTAEQDYKLELKVIREEQAKGEKLAREYVRFARGLVPKHDPDNPEHAFLLRFVKDRCDEFARHGGKDRFRDGKQFVTRDQWYELRRRVSAGLTDKAELEKYWTFNHADMLGMLADNTKASISVRINEEIEYLNSLGYERRAKSSKESGKEAEEVKPTATPKAKATPQRGAAKTQDKKADDTGIDVSILRGG